MEENLVFNLKENTYNLKFPNVGEFRRIESLKQALSSGTYSSLVKTTTSAAQSAADIIDIEATLTVLCPELFEKDLTSKSFEELGMKDFEELRKAYFDQITPWWNNNLKAIGLMSE